MKNAYLPGSFDPVTTGHVDIVERAAAIFGHVTVAVCANAEKGHGLFTPKVRAELLASALSHLSNVTVEILPAGRAVAARAAELSAVLVKGVRGGVDVAYEGGMAAVNHTVLGTDTLWLPARADHIYVSSTVVRELLRVGAPLDGYVPDSVVVALKKAYAAL